MNSNATQSRVKTFAVNNTMLFFAVILFAACLIGVPRFATGGNMMNILIQVSINALIACGMTFVILSDGIDLSVGSVAAIAGVAGASVIKQMPDAGIPLCLAVILAVAVVVGALCGAVNGFCIARLNVPPFIATLAMMNVARGLAYVFTDAKPVFGLPDSFGWLGLRSVGVIPVSIILMVAVIVVSYIVLSKTCFGRYIYAVGSNREVARLTGINVTVTRFWVYVISGILAALAGLLLASKMQNGQAAAATGYELNAIAAVAMGGTSMSGGRGGIPQTVIGLFVIGIINNALSLIGVSSYWQTVSMGAIILFAVIIDQFRKS